MRIESIAKFKIGSTAFFGEYEDFTPKDEDELHVMSCKLFGNSNSYCIKADGTDIIIYSPLSKDEFIENDLNDKDPIKVGKYLVKDFCEYIGMEVNDLKRLKPLIDNIDEKHSYEKIIYDAYIENNDFKLTDLQRYKAYEKYKKTRNL